jgi:hypothetical protein
MSGGIAVCFASIKAKEKGVNIIQVDRAHVGKSGESVYPCCLDIFERDCDHDMDRWLWQVHYKAEHMNDLEWNRITFEDS